MINISDITIEAPEVKDGQYFDTLLLSISKKESERLLLKNFLLADSLAAKKRLGEIVEVAQQKVSANENILDFKSQAIQFYLLQLKSSGAYENMVLQFISNDSDNKSAETASAILRGESPRLSNFFPGDHKRAEGKLLETITSSVGENECRDFQVHQLVKNEINQISKNLFFAINHGLKENQIPSFMAICYELDKVKTANPIGQLKDILLNSIISDQPIQLVHIKSIRFTYPNGSNLRVIENTSEITQEGHLKETRIYPSEEVIFSRLATFRQIFKSYNVDSNLTTIVSDHDLDYCFPPQQQIVPSEDVDGAKDSVGHYINFLRSNHPDVDKIQTLTEFLNENSILEKYNRVFEMLTFQGKGGGGQHLTEKVLEMRVDGQFEHYSKMFPKYTRELARFTAINQIANSLALSIIFESFPSTPLLVIDSRGFEDQLIGGLNPRSVVKLFTKLKDPTQIIPLDIKC